MNSQEFITFSVPSVCAERGKNTFSFSASSSWDTLQKYLQLSQLISLIDFEIKNEFPASSCSKCFRSVLLLRYVISLE